MKAELAAVDSTIKMPVLFVGHGSPMNAIEENEFVEALSSPRASNRLLLQPGLGSMRNGDLTMVHGA